MLKKREAILVALIITAFWATVLVLTSDSTVHCVITFAFREIGAHLDIISALITAIATAFIARYTFTLKGSTDRLWEAGKDQLKLAREEFISSHRPRLRIRSIDRDTSSPTDYIGVKFAVVNVGDTEAQLLGSRVMVDFFQEKPPIDFNGVDVVEPRRFLPGASDNYIVTSSRKWLILQSEYNAARYLFVHGQIVYRNDLGTTYTTSFCRIWNVTANRFKRTDDPDYEYED